MKGGGQELGRGAAQGRQQRVLSATSPCLGSVSPTGGFGASASSKQNQDDPPFGFINPFKHKALGAS